MEEMARDVFSCNPQNAARAASATPAHSDTQTRRHLLVGINNLATLLSSKVVPVVNMATAKREEFAINFKNEVKHGFCAVHVRPHEVHASRRVPISENSVVQHNVSV